jgi:hypothetical protein
MAGGSVWNSALAKRANRRGQAVDTTAHAGAANAHNGNTQIMTDMIQAVRQALGQQLQNTNNTYVMAYSHGFDVFVGVGIPVNNRAALAQQLGLAVGDVQWLSASDVNLHAEMKVVRFFCEEVQNPLAKANLGGDLEIVCVGKPVCQDCCGWMTKHGIPHGPVCGGPSNQGWQNPLSGAVFRGEKNQDFTYLKSKTYKSAATYYSKNPGQK